MPPKWFDGCISFAPVAAAMPGPLGGRGARGGQCIEIARQRYHVAAARRLGLPWSLESLLELPPTPLRYRQMSFAFSPPASPSSLGLSSPLSLAVWWEGVEMGTRFPIPRRDGAEVGWMGGGPRAKRGIC